jgi:hypothetical protein
MRIPNLHINAPLLLIYSSYQPRKFFFRCLLWLINDTKGKYLKKFSLSLSIYLSIFSLLYIIERCHTRKIINERKRNWTIFFSSFSFDISIKKNISFQYFPGTKFSSTSFAILFFLLLLLLMLIVWWHVAKQFNSSHH